MSEQTAQARDHQIRKLTQRHVFTSWAAQAGLDPVPLAGGDGAWFWDHLDNRYLDFCSQLVNTNLGYQHPRLTQAIQEAATGLAMVAPAFTHEARAEAAQRIAGLAPEGLDKVFFTTGGTEANEHAIRMVRGHTGRHKIMAAYRSYHGGTAGSMALTGEPRRWGAEPGMPGVVHFWGPHLYRTEFHAQTPEEECERALEHLRHTVAAEGPELIAGIILESVVGTNGVIVPPEGYLAGVREICDEHGIMMIADEVMAGFGRCGEWFAHQRWGIEPDLIVFAKGVNSGYVPLGGVVLSNQIAATWDEVPYTGGLTYSGHPLACAVAVAAIDVMADEGVVEHARRIGAEVLGPGLRELGTRHTGVGDVRGIGVMWAVEMVTDLQTKAPWPVDRMKELHAACRAEGLWPLPVGNRLHMVPPCVISDDEARQGVAALDRALAGVCDTSG